MPRNPLCYDRFRPTIGSAYDAIEEYLGQLAVLGVPAVESPPLALPPVDALLIRLLASYQPTRPHVVDLAASATWGVSTLLCRTDPSIRRVVTIGEKSPEKWRFALDQYFLSLTLPLVECVSVDGPREALDIAAESQSTALVIASAEAASKELSSADFESWLKLLPQAGVVLLGVDKTGQSSALASLNLRCTDSSYRLALPREMAPALAESRMALVSLRGNSALESALSRIGQLFSNQFHFLDLIKRICDSALEQSILNEPLSTERAGILDPKSLTTTYDLRRALMQREQELMELRQSFTFRILQGIRRLSPFVRRAS